MKSIGRAAALVAVLGMPVVAYALARVSVSMSEGMGSTSLADADAGIALEDGISLLAAAVGATIATYLALTGYAMLLGAAWRGGRTIPKALTALAPRGWTRVTATALGLSLSAGLAAPALATESDSTHVPSAGWVAAPVSVVVDPEPALLSGGWVAAGWVAADATAIPASPQPSGAQVPMPAPVQMPVPVPVQMPVPVPVPVQMPVPVPVPVQMPVPVPVREQFGSTLHDVPPLATAPSETAPTETAPTETAPTETAPTETAPTGVAPFAAAPSGDTSSVPAPQGSGTHIVQPGESLWRITEALLGHEPSTAHIAEAWPQLYEANREAIGDNPSLIQPGMALTIPTGLGA